MIVPRHGARFNIMLGRKTPALRYEDTFCHDNAVMLRIIRSCWKRGVYFHDYGGAACHHGFCAATTEADISDGLSRLDVAVRRLATGDCVGQGEPQPFQAVMDGS